MSRPTTELLRKCAVALLAAIPSPAQDGGPARPNLLFLLADDQRPDAVHAFGAQVLRTPTLDGLAARGTAFREAHCLGSPHGAVCIPSRAMLHSGRAYHGLDLDDFDGAPTLGQLLTGAGYTTFATGKWHNGRGAFSRSFQRGRSIYFGGMCDPNHVTVVDWGDGHFGAPYVGDRHATELFADAAVDFLEGLDEGDGPFFLYAAFTAPHDPRDPPPRFREEYYAGRPPLPANFAPMHPFDNGALFLRDEDLAPWPRTPEVVSDQLAEYYGLISHLDEQVGRILAALERVGHADDTLVVYTADHGLALGSHGLLGKQSLYEHSMGAPLVVAGPGVPAGRESRALVYLHDLFPTLLGQAGVTVPGGIDGRDLAPLWRGEASSVRDTLFTSYGTTQRAVRDARWKLIRYPSVDVTQLFDLESDPHEVRDLSAEPEQAERIARLRTELERRQAELGDALPWTAETLSPREVDFTTRVRKPDRWQPAWIREKYFPLAGGDGD